jgi:hypothetical protein
MLHAFLYDTNLVPDRLFRGYLGTKERWRGVQKTLLEFETVMKVYK